VRAKSSLSLAKIEKPDDVFYEDLCFHAQQAVEKALHVPFIYNGIFLRLLVNSESLILKNNS
jgi:HEPN domain-containing protein